MSAYFEMTEIVIKESRLAELAKSFSEGVSVSDLDRSLVKDLVNGSEGEETNSTKLDDNGNPYMVNGELLPNNIYELNGNVYETDEQSRIVTCNGRPQIVPENQRDNDAQKQSGGEDRRDGDQGGHIIGRDMGGDSGAGNLVPMDARINQSDFKRMENEIKKAVVDGKDVTAKTEFTYSGESKRPDKITVTVTVDGKDTVYTFDNNLNGSLMEKVVDTCSETDVENVQSVLDETGGEISSVKEELDSDGNLVKTTITITYSGEDGKTYRRTDYIDHARGGNQQ